MTIILATQEAEMKKIEVLGQPAQKFMRPPAQPMASIGRSRSRTA
jgi:hypothetical protein